MREGPIRVLHLAPDAGSQNGIARYARRYRELFADSEYVQIESFTIAGVGPPNTFRGTGRYVRRLAHRADRYDVVHAECGGGTLEPFYGALATAAAGTTPVVLTVHDPPWPVKVPFHVNSLRQHQSVGLATAMVLGNLARRLETALLRRASAIIVLSDAGRRALAATVEPHLSAPVTVMPHVATPAGPAALTSDVSEGLFGYLGYWYPGKGIGTLLQALRLLLRDGHRVRLRLWGEASMSFGSRPSELYRRRLVSMSQAGDLRESVELRGWLPEAEMVSELTQLQAVVLPHDNRASASVSGSAVDALSCGCPVIASRTPAFAELVRDGHNGLLVPVGDPGAVARAMLRVLQDRAFANRLREGARNSCTDVTSTIVGRAVKCYAEAAGHLG
jgi:glycosyltransferase involved in cell wall biosynthesis